MPHNSKNKLKIFNSINRFARMASEKMDTEESSNENDYSPIDDSALDEIAFSDLFLVDMINLVLDEPCLRTLSAFSFALLKKCGIGALEIRKLFSNIGLQREQTCRENIIKIQKSEFELLSGG